MSARPRARPDGVLVAATLACCGISGGHAVAAPATSAAPGQAREVAAAGLDGMDQGPSSPFTHPRGWFTLELPRGWSVAQQPEGALVINPGLASSDSLDALVIVTYGELDDTSPATDVVALFERMKPALVQDLASQSIVVADAVIPPRRNALRHGEGVVQEWKGTGGGKDVLVWIGGLAEREYYLAVIAVVVAEKEARFLPGVKRMLHSVQPRPPERNHAVEAAIVGARFSAIDTRPGGSRGSFSAIFEFHQGQRVKKTQILSGMVGLSGIGGESEEWGGYEVIGDEVHIAFAAEQDRLALVVEQGRIVALRRGDRIYRRR